jgi:hypothetical protein
MMSMKECNSAVQLILGHYTSEMGDEGSGEPFSLSSAPVRLGKL